MDLIENKNDDKILYQDVIGSNFKKRLEYINSFSKEIISEKKSKLGFKIFKLLNRKIKFVLLKNNSHDAFLKLNKKLNFNINKITNQNIKNTLYVIIRSYVYSYMNDIHSDEYQYVEQLLLLIKKLIKSKLDIVIIQSLVIENIKRCYLMPFVKILLENKVEFDSEQINHIINDYFFSLQNHIHYQLKTYDEYDFNSIALSKNINNIQSTKSLIFKIVHYCFDHSGRGYKNIYQMKNIILIEKIIDLLGTLDFKCSFMFNQPKMNFLDKLIKTRNDCYKDHTRKNNDFIDTLWNLIYFKALELNDKVSIHKIFKNSFTYALSF